MTCKPPLVNEQTGLYWDETVQGWKQFRPWDSTFTDRLRQEASK